MRAEVVLLSGRVVVVDGRLVAEERCVVVVGRLAIVGRLEVVVVGRLEAVVVGRTLLLLLEGLTLLDAVRDVVAVLAPLGVVVFEVR